MGQNMTRSQTEVERQRIQEVIDKHRPEMALAGVRRVEFALGEDSTGDPAVKVVMVIGKDLQPTKEKIGELNDFAQILVNDIIDLESDFWPYVRTSVEE